MLNVQNLKGLLYRKLHSVKKETYPKTRAGQLLYLMKERSTNGYPKFSISPVKNN